MSRDTGGSAFPFPPLYNSDGCGIYEGSNGMTLRDYFAGRALAGIAGQSKTFTDALVLKARELGIESEQYAAQMAYVLADAMIAERNKEIAA